MEARIHRKVSRVAHGWAGFVTFRSLWKLECLYQILSTQLAINVQLLRGWWYLACFGGSPLKGRGTGLLTFRCLVAPSLTSLNSIGVASLGSMKFRSGSNESDYLLEFLNCGISFSTFTFVGIVPLLWLLANKVYFRYFGFVVKLKKF